MTAGSQRTLFVTMDTSKSKTLRARGQQVAVMPDLNELRNVNGSSANILVTWQVGRMWPWMMKQDSDFMLVAFGNFSSLFQPSVSVAIL